MVEMQLLLPNCRTCRTEQTRKYKSSCREVAGGDGAGGGFSPGRPRVLSAAVSRRGSREIVSPIPVLTSSQRGRRRHPKPAPARAPAAAAEPAGGARPGCGGRARRQRASRRRRPSPNPTGGEARGTPAAGSEPAGRWRGRRMALRPPAQGGPRREA